MAKNQHTKKQKIKKKNPRAVKRKRNQAASRLQFIALGIVFIVTIGISSTILQGTENLKKTQSAQANLEKVSRVYSMNCDDVLRDDYGPCDSILGAYFDGEKCSTIYGCSGDFVLPFKDIRTCENACMEDEENINAEEAVTDTKNQNSPAMNYDLDASGNKINSFDEKNVCEEAGGTWKQWLSENFSCNFPTEDAGEICTDSAECETLCVADPQSTGEPLSGTCFGWKQPYGCITEINNGEIGKTICIN